MICPRNSDFRRRMLPPGTFSPPITDLGSPLMNEKWDGGHKNSKTLSRRRKGKKVRSPGSRIGGVGFDRFRPGMFIPLDGSFRLYQPSTLDQAINHGRGKGIGAQDDLPMAEGSIRGNHDGAFLISIEDHLETELNPLLAHG